MKNDVRDAVVASTSWLFLFIYKVFFDPVYGKIIDIISFSALVVFFPVVVFLWSKLVFRRFWRK